MKELYTIVNRKDRLWSPEDGQFLSLKNALSWSNEAIGTLESAERQLPYAKERDDSAVIKQVTITFTDLPVKK